MSTGGTNVVLTLASLQARFPRVNIGQALNVLPEYNVLYVTNPKAACSTIKQLLYRCHTHYDSTDPDKIHSDAVLPRKADLGWPRVIEMLTGGAFRFTFVRDPLDRVISAYSDKIVGRHSSLYAPKVRAALGLPDRRTIALEEFLDFVAGQPPDELDPHWRPQTINVLYGAFTYDFVGRVERMEADIAQLKERTGLPDLATHWINKSNRRTQIQNPKLLGLVKKIYETDYEAFGY